MNTKQTKQLHAEVIAMFSAYNGAVKAEGAEYRAVAHTLKTVALNDAEIVKALRDDLLAVFGEAHKDAAQIRINIVNNARRVAFGGTKDGKAIRGKGMSALLEVVGMVQSVRELRKALAENVPDALKPASGGDRKSGKKGKGKSNPLSVPKVATRDEAFAAAKKILEFVRDKFTKPSETVLTERINKCIESFDAPAPVALKAAA